MAIVPIRTFDWIGTFQLVGSCNATACCCPSSDLAIKRNGAKNDVTLNVTGLDCKANPAHTSVSIDNNATNGIYIPSLGNFTSKDDVELDVLLEQNGTARAGCKVTMKRLLTSTVSNSNVTGTLTTGSKNNTGETTEENTNHGSSNHGSIFLTFISIIMATTVLMHI